MPSQRESLSCSSLVSKDPPFEYYRRFPLCVLDTIRTFQEYPSFVNGLRMCHIVDHLKDIRTLDGDIEAQVVSSLVHLENSGLVMLIDGGYRTMGPYAKICSSKTPKQRRQAWDRIESTLNVPSMTNQIRQISKRLPVKENRIFNSTSINDEQYDC